MSAIAQDSVLGRINALLAEVDGEKRATELGTSGSAAKDPGGYAGKSTHPSAKTDDKSGPVELGSRFKENEKDVKEVYPAAVDNTEPGSGGTQDDKAYNVGTHVSETGEDPKVEDNYKGHKEDPGTTHPSDMSDNDKYASMRTDVLFKEAFFKMNALLAAIASDEPIAKSATTEKTKVGAKEAAQAGYALSSSLIEQPTFDKAALAHAVLENTIKEALTDADNVAAYLYARQEKLAAEYKRANEVPPEVMMGADGGMGGAGGGMPPAMPPEGEAPMSGGGEEAPPPPPEEMGGGEGGKDEEAVEQLMNALQELGIPPETLLQASQDAESGPAKVASARHPLVTHIAESLTKHANDARALNNLSQMTINLRDKGRIKTKSAWFGSKERAERDEIKAYIREVCGLSA